MTIDLTDAWGSTTGFEEGGSRKRKYQEGLAGVEGWGRKKSKKDRADKLGAVFEDRQERQVDLLRRMSNLIEEEDFEEFRAIVEALARNWEEAEEELKKDL